jgi:hypothetical protein
MRWFLALLCLTAIYLASCKTEGDQTYITNVYPNDTTGHDTVYIDTTGNPHSVSIQVVYPPAYATEQTLAEWTRVSNQEEHCVWRYRVDTVFSAVIATNFRSTLLSAMVFVKRSDYSDYDLQATIYNPSNDTIRIPFYRATYSLSSMFTADSVNGSFWVRIMDEDSTNYISPTRNFKIVLHADDHLTAPPAAPYIDTVIEAETYQNIAITYCVDSPGVIRTILFYQAQGTSHVESDTSTTDHVVTLYRYLPVTQYAVWIKQQNSIGLSPASDTSRLFTREPAVPTYLSASVGHSRVVDLHWSNHVSYCDSILIGRRTASDVWHTIEAISQSPSPNLTTYYTDTTVVANTNYLYRVGVAFSNGVWWCQDSVGVWIP